MKQVCFVHFLIASFSAAIALTQPAVVAASARVVRGGGGFAELQAWYVLNELPKLVGICERAPSACAVMSQQNRIHLEEMAEALALTKSLTVDQSAACSGATTVFDASAGTLFIESCILYDFEYKPLSYDKILSTVFLSVCQAAVSGKSDRECNALLGSLRSEIVTRETSLVLYQELRSVMLRTLSVRARGIFDFHLSLEYFGSSYDITEDVLSLKACESLTGFEIGAVRTAVSSNRAVLTANIEVSLSCLTKSKPQEFSARLLIQVPTDEARFARDSGTIRLTSVRALTAP